LSGRVGAGNDLKSGETLALGGLDSSCGRPKSRISSGGAVGRVESRDLDIKVRTSGKYPPLIDPFLAFGDCSSGDTLLS
jgi:hypothetical protein